MGDRWSYPKQASAATYVWLPFTISGTTLSLPIYSEAWRTNTATGTVSNATIGTETIKNTDKRISYSGHWKMDTLAMKSADEKDASFSLDFKGTQIGWYGLASPAGGYARVVLRNSKGELVLSSTVDTYCKYASASLKFLSPVLPKDTYTFTVSVMGERPNWSDKRKSNYGSTGYFVSLDKIVFNP